MINTTISAQSSLQIVITNSNTSEVMIWKLVVYETKDNNIVIGLYSIILFKF